MGIENIDNDITRKNQLCPQLSLKSSAFVLKIQIEIKYTTVYRSSRVYEILSGSTRIYQGLSGFTKAYQSLSGSSTIYEDRSGSTRVSYGILGSSRIYKYL
jgi:hypothetical protein